MSEILNLYHNHVNYFGVGIVDKSFIRRDKESYCQRWARIRYKLTGEIIVQDTEDEAIKLVEFYISFYTYSSKRGSILGTARNYLKIYKRSDEFKIIDEKQDVLSREKSSE